MAPFPRSPSLSTHRRTFVTHCTHSQESRLPTLDSRLSTVRLPKCPVPIRLHPLSHVCNSPRPSHTPPSHSPHSSKSHHPPTSQPSSSYCTADLPNVQTSPTSRRRSAHLGLRLTKIGRHFTWLFEAIQQRFRHMSGSLGAQTTRFFHSVVTVELFFWRRCTKQQPNQVHGRGCVEAAAQTFHKQSYTGSSGSTKRPESPAFEAVAVAALQRCCRKCAIVLQNITARAAASDIPRSRLAKAG